MSNVEINPLNVVKIAQYLLELDISYIKEKFQYDFYPFAQSLQQALIHYCNHQGARAVDDKPVGWSTIDWIEYHSSTLIQCTKAVLSLLTSEAQSRLNQYLKKV